MADRSRINRRAFVKQASAAGVMTAFPSHERHLAVVVDRHAAGACVDHV